MKVVSIGNSFANNMQRFAHQIAQASGQDLTVVNAYYPGCTMQMHVDFLQKDDPVYDLYKNGVCAEKGVTLKKILTSEEFDYVTLQPGTSGWQTYGRVPDLFPYILDLVAAAMAFQPRADLIYNHYWSDSSNGKRALFTEFFSGDRNKMLAWWQEYADRAAQIPDIRFVNPCWAAVEEAYPALGDRLYDDGGYHLSAIGSYLQGCLWTEFFTGAHPSDTFIPDGVSITPREASLLRDAAHRAVLSCGKTPAGLEGA